MSGMHLWSVGLTAPGMPDWASARPVLAGQRARQDGPVEPFQPGFLPSNELRRTTRTIKLALQVAHQAIAGLPTEASELATVLASSCGDSEVTLKICRSLAQADHPVSPIQFHNSVHNAAAGYWTIAWQSNAPSLSLGAFDGTFAAGLMEAYTQVVSEGRTVLLVAYELPPPTPLSEVRPLRGPFGTALLLAPERRKTGPSLGKLTLTPLSEGTETPCREPDLEGWRTGNPAARSLPLLQAVAQEKEASPVLPFTQHLNLQVTHKGP